MLVLGFAVDKTCGGGGIRTHGGKDLPHRFSRATR